MDNTRGDYEEWVNEVGVPEDDKKSNGGRIPDNALYGSWLRRNDPVAFNVGYGEWKMEQARSRRSDAMVRRHANAGNSSVKRGH